MHVSSLFSSSHQMYMMGLRYPVCIPQLPHSAYLNGQRSNPLNMPRIPFTVSTSDLFHQVIMKSVAESGLLLSICRGFTKHRNAVGFPYKQMTPVPTSRAFAPINSHVKFFLTCFNTLLNVMSRKQKSMKHKVFRFQQVQNINCKVVEISLETGRFSFFLCVGTF